MKRIFVFVAFLALAVLTGNSCSKGGGGSCNEARLVFTTTPALNSTEPPSPGPTFPLQVNVTQNLPAGGVSITVSAKPEAGGNNFFSETKTTTAGTASFTITGAPQNVISLVQVTVTSSTCGSNTASGTYKFTRK